MSKRTHRGSDLRDFLKEEGILEEVEARAMKQALALQLTALLKKNELTKVEMAVRMKTSRAAVDRLPTSRLLHEAERGCVPRCAHVRQDKKLRLLTIKLYFFVPICFLIENDTRSKSSGLQKSSAKLPAQVKCELQTGLKELTGFLSCLPLDDLAACRT